MAFGIKVGSTFLDIDEGSQLTFEINTELWVTGEPNINVGSYSFPIDLPLTDTNRYLLRFPERIEAYTTLEVIENAVIYVGQGKSIGLPMFAGRLFVKNATNRKCSVFLVVEGLSRQKEKKVKDVDLGVFDIGGPVTLESLMNGTIEYPLLSDFVFFPVWNESIKNIYQGTPNIEFIPNNVFGAARMNHWVTDNFNCFAALGTHEGVEIKNNLMIVPFLRLEVVLELITTSIGYTLINEWIGNNDELRSICIFNNKSINDLDTGHKSKIRYNEHLPKEMLVTDILKDVSKFAFCGLFVNHYSKTITMRPYRQVLSSGPRQNWTDRATTDYEIEQDNKLPNYIGYGVDDGDDYFDNNYVSSITILLDGAIVTDYWESGGNPNTHSLIDGYYHVKRDNSVMRYDPSKTWLYERWTKFNHQFKQIYIGGNGDAYLAKVIPMWSDSGTPTISDLPYNYSIPRADVGMNMDLRFGDDVDDVVHHNAELTTLRLMMYRGMRSFADGAKEYPYANATAYDPATEDETFNHSLHLDGDKGMYAQYGRDWMTFMQRKKIVKRYLNLSIADILNHREYDKIRIGNMDYFVKSIKVNVNNQGMGLSECELVTVPFSTKIG